MSCEVRAISGTSSSTSPPRERVSAIKCIYISVLPEPVTPCRRFTRWEDEAISPCTRCCSAESVGNEKLIFLSCSTTLSRSATVIYPALRNAAICVESHSSRRRGTSPKLFNLSFSNPANTLNSSALRGARRDIRSHSASRTSLSCHPWARAT